MSLMLHRVLATAVVLSVALSGATTCAGSMLGMAPDCGMPMHHDCSPAGDVGADCCVANSKEPASATVPGVLLSSASATVVAVGPDGGLFSITPASAETSLGVLQRTFLEIPLHPIHLVLSVFLI